MMKDSFYGRQAYLALLEKRVQGLKEGYRQNIAIIGDELVGKTAIVHHFLATFNDPQIIVNYLEIRPEPLVNFCSRFIAVMLYNFLSRLDQDLAEDIESLIGKAAPRIPRTVAHIKKVLAETEKKKKDALFADLLCICDTLHQETGTYCVVIFDEFHHLEHLGQKKLYAEWGKLLMVQKTTLYVLMSSARYKAQSILAKDLSLLFGNFEVVTVDPFDIRETEGFLQQRIGCLKLNPAHKDFIIHFTGGYPFYLDAIAKSIVTAPLSPLTTIIEDLLFTPAGLLYQHFSSRLKRFQSSIQGQQYLSMLYQIADGHTKIKDIAHLMHITKKELDGKIVHLLEQDTIIRSGDFLKIADRVFSFWLKFVYQEKLNSLTFDAKNQKMLFRKKIDSLIDDFVHTAQRPIIERLSEVLHLFGGDHIQIERKRLRLNKFREIKSLEFDTHSLREGLLCRSNDSLWIIALTRQSLTEDDIAHFAKECRKYRQKLQKKIIVALQEIDQNSRLRALEEKITTWNLTQINELMDVFSKPRIIS